MYVIYVWVPIVSLRFNLFKTDISHLEVAFIMLNQANLNQWVHQILLEFAENFFFLDIV